MQPPRSRTDQLGETGLDIEVDVLVLFTEDEGSGVDLAPDLR
jgi:hypothetical protein